MTADGDVNNEAKNVQESQESVDAKEQESNIGIEKTEPQNVQEATEEKDESKSVKQEDIKEKNNSNKGDKKNDSPIDANLMVRITGFTKLNNESDQMKLYYSFFTQEIGISAPLVEMSTQLDDSVIFQLKSEEDKKVFFSKVKRRTLFKWKNCKLEMKGIPSKSMVKEANKLPLEKALEILYPYKSIPYGKQLKEKAEISENVIRSILTMKTINFKIKPVVPMAPVEGYDYHLPFSIEEEPETKQIIFGIRVVSPDKNKICIVPIDKCPNVPHQMALAAKDFVDHMREFSFTPFNYKTNQGNILGITLQMTQSGTFIMTIVVPTTKLEQFKQLTLNGAEGTVITANKPSGNNETKETLTEKAEKYFKSRAKDHDILSIYMSPIYPGLGSSWFAEQVLPDAHHICGDTSVSNYYNGLQVQVMWTKDYLINNSVMSILNIIQEWGYINCTSSIYLVSNYKIVALYLAHKVERLTMFCSSKRGNLVMMKAWAKNMGLNKIDFFDVRGNRNSALISSSTTAIIWQTIKKPIVDILLARGITNFLYVSYWTKDPPSEFINSSKEALESVLHKLEISNIFPIDVAPYTDRIALLMFLHTKKHLLARKRSYESLERLQTNYYPYEEEFNQAKRLRGNYY